MLGGVTGKARAGGPTYVDLTAKGLAAAGRVNYCPAVEAGLRVRLPIDVVSVRALRGRIRMQVFPS